MRKTLRMTTKSFFGLGKSNGNNKKNILSKISSGKEDKLPVENPQNGTKHYLFVGFSNFRIPDGLSNQDYAQAVADRLNTNSEPAEFFASFQSVGESEVYDFNDYIFYIALPENFKLSFLGNHDRNVRYRLEDTVKPEYIVGVPMGIGSRNNSVSALSSTQVHFLNERLEIVVDGTLTASEIYNRAFTGHLGSTWIGAAPFNVIAPTFINNHNNTSGLRTYEVLINPEERTQINQIDFSTITVPESQQHTNGVSQQINNTRSFYQMPPPNSLFWEPIAPSNQVKQKTDTNKNGFPSWFDDLPVHLKQYAKDCWTSKLDIIDEDKFDAWHEENKFFVKPICYATQLFPKIPVTLHGELFCLESLYKCQFKNPKDRSKFTWTDVEPTIIARDQLMGLKKQFPEENKNNVSILT